MSRGFSSGKQGPVGELDIHRGLQGLGSTCYGWVEVLEVHLLVGPLAAGQTPGKDGQVLCQGALHVLRAASEVPAVVDLHSPEEHGLEEGRPGSERPPPQYLPSSNKRWGPAQALHPTS